MKVLIIGMDGQLGSELMRIVDEAIGTSRRGQSGVQMDLRNRTELEDTIMKLSPDVIVNTAAMTDVDYCETNTKEAYEVNALAVRNIVRAASVVGSYFIHISTDYVFDGEKGNYEEGDTPIPINYYGFSKSVGEAFAMSYDDALVIRTSGLYGIKMNFPLFVVKTLKSGNTVKCIDSNYSPIHATQLAQVVKEVISRRIYGILHVSGPRISRFEFANKIKDRLGIEGGKIVLSKDIPTMRARRPYDSSLNVSKAKRILNYKFDDIDEGIRMLGERYEVI